MRQPDSLIDLSHLDRLRQVEAWDEYTWRESETTDRESALHDDTPFRSAAWKLKDIVLTETSFPVATVLRMNTHIRRARDDYLRLRIFTSGGGSALVDGSDVRFTPGDVSFMKGSAQIQMTASGRGIVGLYIPYDTIGLDPTRLPSHFALSGEAGAGRLISSALTSTLADMPGTRPNEMPALAAGIIGMLRGVLALTRPDDLARGSFQVLRWHAVKTYIDDHLDDLDLDVVRLCKVFNMSRSSLYRMFKPFGGLQVYLHSQRLDRCLDDLVISAPDRGSVRRVAERWGYFNPPHFYRRFRSRFGFSPSDAVEIDANLEQAILPSANESPTLDSASVLDCMAIVDSTTADSN